MGLILYGCVSSSGYPRCLTNLTTVQHNVDNLCDETSGLVCEVQVPFYKVDILVLALILSYPVKLLYCIQSRCSGNKQPVVVVNPLG
eukprot:NODE_2641_length_412_cov_6.217631_g2560_i0.p1 GENE.NODE_2641_length_412_cov_6.217631_g2560_i0~~NODE_2641_length_412_cov_6.217631_g2560_i0.p1  ORF type:complete len:87 (-),score=10.84 NODE_2641_length_412_cov_6.217631_g2560_i0:18-278(-)